MRGTAFRFKQTLGYSESHCLKDSEDSGMLRTRTELYSMYSMYSTVTVKTIDLEMYESLHDSGTLATGEIDGLALPNL